jgi:diadenosine tetraphosphatase ApaH/serine/threonine PP2A family protein phosphatase
MAICGILSIHFCILPLIVVIDHKFCCVHGDLSPGLTNLEQISTIKLPISHYDHCPIVSDLVWSDPHDTVPEFAENH